MGPPCRGCNVRTIQSAATRRDRITIIHDAVPADVEAYPSSPGLGAIIRNPELRRTFFRTLAADPEARLTLAIADGVIAGRVSIGPSFGRWRTLPQVREIAIEAAREWRRGGLASRLTQAALADPAVEDEILLAFTLPSAWDLEYESLTPLAYARLLAEFLGKFRFRLTGTDEPEVRWERHAALLVRIGARVPPDAVAAFDRARYIDGERRPAAA